MGRSGASVAQSGLPCVAQSGLPCLGLHPLAVLGQALGAPACIHALPLSRVRSGAWASGVVRCCAAARCTV